MTDRRETCIAIVNLPPRAMMSIDSCGMLISAVHHEEGAEKLHLLQVDPHVQRSYICFRSIRTFRQAQNFIKI